MGMWFSGRYVNGGSPTNLVALLQQVRWKASEDKMQEDILALGAIGEHDERMRENEEMRGFKKMRESGSEEKKEGREGGFCREKKRGKL